MASDATGKIKLLVIQGPTASGKTDLALHIAEEIGGEIINADSMQVYRGMDIGTAKPSPETRRRVPHHLLDIVNPDVNFTANNFRQAAAPVIADIAGRGRKPIVVGGTGLYIRALINGLVDAPPADELYRAQLQQIANSEGGEVLLERLEVVDPVTASRLHPNDHVRIIRALEVYHQCGKPISGIRDIHGFSIDDYHCLKLGINVSRDELYKRIDCRVDRMLADGLVDEVRGLLSCGWSSGLKAMKSIGYREICSYINGEFSFEESIRLIKRNTRHYAKRQETWFRVDPEISWVEYPETFAIILNHVNAFFY
jgi:tRNA dimethylallyltransferase